jgi:2-dehydro-3-deoxyglucarate aldolase
VTSRCTAVNALRTRLAAGGTTVGSWMQLPDTSVAEIMGRAGYDWVAIDMEHGAIDVGRLPDLCRALELGGTLPLVRLAQVDATMCKRVLDAGAGGVIVPMIESAHDLIAMRDACRWPPAGTRGVGFSRANLFGKFFDDYVEEAQAPWLVAMIENQRAVVNLEQILAVPGLDAILIGPYDLSASMGRTAQFADPEFEAMMSGIRNACAQANVACGVHVVAPSPDELRRRQSDGYRFLAYSIDAVMLHRAATRPPE